MKPTLDMCMKHDIRSMAHITSIQMITHMMVMSTFSPETFSCFPSGYIFRRAGFPYRSLQCSKKERRRRKKCELDYFFIFFSSPDVIHTARGHLPTLRSHFYCSMLLLLYFGNQEMKKITRFSEISIIIYFADIFLVQPLAIPHIQC